MNAPVLVTSGHELASHSVTHRLPQSEWTRAGYDRWRLELAGQRQNLAALGGVPAGQVRGTRAPFLETGGDTQYRMMSDQQVIAWTDY